LFTDLNTVSGSDTALSVHLADFPDADDRLIDAELESRMQIAQQVSSMILALRRKVGIKVRQPLSTIMIPAVDDVQKKHIMAVSSLILGEVNVKELVFVDNTAGILVKRIKPDFKKLGPKCGKLMKEVAGMLTGLSQEAILGFEKQTVIDLTLEGQPIRVDAIDVEILSEDIPGWLVANEGRLTVALDVTVTDALRLEGTARELVNRIQNIRKTNGFEITDKIRVTLSPDEEIARTLSVWKEYIMVQTLAGEITQKVITGSAMQVDLDGLLLNVLIEKA